MTQVFSFMQVPTPLRQPQESLASYFGRCVQHFKSREMVSKSVILIDYYADSSLNIDVDAKKHDWGKEGF